MQVSDTQDMKYVRKAMVNMLDNAYDKLKPDLVLFTGDNILGNHLLDARFGSKQIASGKQATLTIDYIYIGPAANAPAVPQFPAKLFFRKQGRNRKAHFSCCMALAYPNEKTMIFEGRVDGNISPTPSGNGGFGYDPIFIPEGFDKTFAELGEDIKNKMSHRSRALEKLINKIK